MATSDATEPRYWLIDNPHRDEPSLPEPASARGGAGPYLVPIVDEVYGGVIAWANTPDLAERIVTALAAAVEDERECEHRWRDYSDTGIGVVCRDCGAPFVDEGDGTDGV